MKNNQTLIENSIWFQFGYDLWIQFTSNKIEQRIPIHKLETALFDILYEQLHINLSASIYSSLNEF